MGWLNKNVFHQHPQAPNSTNFDEWRIFLRDHIKKLEIVRDDKVSIQFKIGNFDSDNDELGKDYVIFRVLHSDAVNYIYSNQQLFLFASVPFLFIMGEATNNDLSMYIKHASPDLRKKFFIPFDPQEIYGWIKKHFPDFLKEV